jgi:hypothetical protein
MEMKMNHEEFQIFAGTLKCMADVLESNSSDGMKIIMEEPVNEKFVIKVEYEDNFDENDIATVTINPYK